MCEGLWQSHCNHWRMRKIWKKWKLFDESEITRQREEIKRSSKSIETEKVCHQWQLKGILITFYSSANKIALCDAKCQQHWEPKSDQHNSRVSLTMMTWYWSLFEQLRTSPDRERPRHSTGQLLMACCKYQACNSWFPWGEALISVTMLLKTASKSNQRQRNLLWPQSVLRASS